MPPVGVPMLAGTAMRHPVSFDSARVVLAIALGVALTNCATGSRARLSPADSLADWSAVVALSPGDRLRIEKTGGTVMAGRLVAAGPTDVAIAGSHGDVTHVARADVERVFQARRRTAEKARWGAILGAAIGASDGVWDWREVLVYAAR
jgi:hypothetical protein